MSPYEQFEDPKNLFLYPKSHTQKFAKLMTNLVTNNPEHPLSQLGLSGDTEKVKEVIHDELCQLYRHMERYGLGMSSEGELVDLETGKFMYPPHLICMLKKDHTSKYFNTTKLYEWLVVAAIEGYQIVAQSPNLPESEKKDLAIVHEFL